MSMALFMLVIISGAIHAIWNFAARRAAGNMGVVWNGLWFGSLAAAPFAVGGLHALWSRALWHVLASGAINAFYFIVVAKAYENGEISRVYPVARGSGVAGASIAARFLLNEVVSPLAAAGIFAVCIGIFLLCMNPSNEKKRSSLLHAFLMGGAMVAASLVDKTAMNRASPVSYIFCQMVIAAALMAPYVWLRHRQRFTEAWNDLKLYSLVIGCGSLISYGLILFAFQFGSLSVIVPFREIGVVIGALLGIILLGEPFTLKKGSGIAIITAGLALLRIG